MRWDNLFDDLESQLEQELTADEVDLRAEEERLRLARLGVRDRLISLHQWHGGEAAPILDLVLRDGSRAAMVPESFGKDWVAGALVEEGGHRPSCVVPLEAIGSISLTRQQVEASLTAGSAEPAERSLSARLGVAFVLRDLCRRRQPLELRMPGNRLFGTIDRVGRDHCDLAVHDPGSVRRESAVTEYRVVRFSEILLVRLAL